MGKSVNWIHLGGAEVNLGVAENKVSGLYNASGTHTFKGRSSIRLARLPIIRMLGGKGRADSHTH